MTLSDSYFVFLALKKEHFLGKLVGYRTEFGLFLSSNEFAIKVILVSGIRRFCENALKRVLKDQNNFCYLRILKVKLLQFSYCYLFVFSVGASDCLAILIKKGADVNAQDRSGVTPLQLAARNG